MGLIGPINSGAAAGGAGVATATGASTVPVCGYVVAVYVKYNHAPPAGTTDVTVRTKGTSPRMPSQTILAVANAATDAVFYPEVPHHLASTGAAITDYYGPAYIDDIVEVVIAQANDADNIDVWLLVEG